MMKDFKTVSFFDLSFIVNKETLDCLKLSGKTPLYNKCLFSLLSDISHRAFEDVVSVSRDEVSLGSPEVLRRLECSEDRLPERFHASALGSRLSELSALNSTGLHVKTSPRVEMEAPHSRTITPEPATRSSHSPGSMSDNFSMMDSADTDKVNNRTPTCTHAAFQGVFETYFAQQA